MNIWNELMKHLLMALATTTVIAGTAQAEVRATSLQGTTSDPVYSQIVAGSDGNSYKCKPDIVIENGVRKRICLPLEAVAVPPLFKAGDGLTGPGPILGVAISVVAVAAAGGDSPEATHTVQSGARP